MSYPLSWSPSISSGCDSSKLLNGKEVALFEQSALDWRRFPRTADQRAGLLRSFIINDWELYLESGGAGAGLGTGTPASPENL